MKHDQKISVESFFSSYDEYRKSIANRIDTWGEQKSKAALVGRIGRLISQIEEHKSALKALLEDESANREKITLLFGQVRQNYKELRQLCKPVWQQWAEAIIVAGVAAFIIRSYVFGLYQVPTGSAEPNILVGDRIFGDKVTLLYQQPKIGDLVIFDDPEFTYDRSFIQRLWQRYIGLPFLFFKAGPENWVKRVLALPGDTIEGRIENGKTFIYRNGEQVDESAYINKYPLIGVRRRIGLVDPYSVLGALVPSFLYQYDKMMHYVYDPALPFAQQPFYLMSESEILRHPYTKEPIILQPRDPMYDQFNRNVDSFGPLVVPEGKYWVQGDSRRNSRDSRYWGFLDSKLIRGRARYILFSIDSEEPTFLLAILKNPWKFFTKQLRWGRWFRSLALPSKTGDQ